jgi:hypothetical protein
MGEDSAADRFEFVLTLMIPAKEGLSDGSSYWVARDGKEMAAAVYSGRGEPYGYATKRFLGVLGPPATGTLSLLQAGSPRFVFAAARTGAGLESELSFVRDDDAPRVDVQLGPVLEGVLKKAVGGSFDAKTNSVRLLAEKSTVSIMLAKPHGQGSFPVEAIAIASKAGVAVILSDIRTGGERPRILGLKTTAFRETGLTIRQLDQRDAKLPLLVPSTFGSSDAERQAIEKMRAILPSLPKPSGNVAERK